MCALVAWTFAVLLLSANAGESLLELPVLFYVVCLALYVTLGVDPLAVVLAWLYFALCAAHSVVHLTYDNAAHRRGVHAASMLALAALWIRFGIALVQR